MAGKAELQEYSRGCLHRVSKGTIWFPYAKPLPGDLIAEIAVWCYKQYAK